MSVEVCPICDIAGCRHIRERNTVTPKTYTEAEVKALIAAAVEWAAQVAYKTPTGLLPSGHFLSERCGDAIRASIPADAEADHAARIAAQLEGMG